MNLEAEAAQDVLRRIELQYDDFLRVEGLMDSPTTKLSFYISTISVLDHPAKPFAGRVIVMRELRYKRDMQALLIQGALPSAKI